VRNRGDGSVELVASGSDEAVGALIEACRQGPRAAIVSDVAVVDAADAGSTGFSAKPTV
jgi:acylphosphatase